MVSHHLRSLVTLVIMVVPTRFSPFVEHEGEEQGDCAMMGNLR